MSDRRSLTATLKVTCIAALAGLISFFVIDSGPARGQSAAATSHGLQQPSSVQHPSFSSRSALGSATADERQMAIEAFDLSPAVFVANKGQWDSQIRYGFDGKGTRVSFTDAGPVFEMTRRDGESGEVSQAVFSATFVGAKKVQPVGTEQSPSTTNYYVGNDSAKWQNNVPSYQKVLYRGIYEGVDLCTWGKRSGLKYEFHLAPGASWERIIVRYAGISSLTIDEKGALHVRTPLGEIVDGAPVAYQETAAGRKEIASAFRLVDDRSYGFDVTGAYDKSLPIVIDPELVWGSYLGGSGRDEGKAIAADGSGNCYVTGWTNSTDFPTSGGFDTSYNGSGNADVFVAKVTSSGQLAWASYLGGSKLDYGKGIGVDASGDCYVTGCTNSSDFPTPGGFYTDYNGAVTEAFVAKMTSSGQLAWSNYLGGSMQADGRGIAVDALGDCYVTGFTLSADFPTLEGSDNRYSGSYGDVFVAKVTPSGQLAWASYFGGGDYDGGNAIAMDTSGGCFVTGYTSSSDFATPGGFDTCFGGGDAYGDWDAFVAKVTSSGQLAWASYLGGSGHDAGNGAATDASGNCYVTGETTSEDFPTSGGFDTSFNGGKDAFVAKVTLSGQLAWASYLGGTSEDEGRGIAVDASGNCCITGSAESRGFPVSGGFDTTYNGDYEAFVASVTSSGQLAWASYLGGSYGDQGNAIAADASGNCYVTGFTWSLDFPTPGGFDTSYNGGPWPNSGDIFVATIRAVEAPDPLIITTAGLPDGVAGAAYSTMLEAAGGVPPYGWSISSGTLPAGLSLDPSTGVIDGTATAAGTSEFTVTVTDNQPITADKALSIEIQPAAATTELRWLEITRFTMTVPGTAGRDSFFLHGSLNMPVAGNAPRTVTLTIDGWSSVMDASSWKRVGKSNVYRCDEGGVAGKMTYWVNGTSKCIFTFAAKKQALEGNLPNSPNVPVRLEAGGDFDETAVVNMTVSSQGAKLSSVGPLPVFCTEKLTVTKNLHLSGHDALSFSGKVFLDGDFDPAADALTMNIGPYQILLPAGTIGPAQNGVFKYTAATAHETMLFRLNNGTHVLTVTATGVDISSVTEDIEVSLTIANHPGADWDYGLTMAGNNAGTVYRY